MKKIFMNLSVGATLATAILLTACNNAEQVKKQQDEENAKVQSMVDAKLNDLQQQANTECSAKVDSAATAMFNTWKEEAKAPKKGGKKAKPVAKKEEKKVDKGATNYRPGASTPNETKKTTDRPGSSTPTENKKTTDRPGANTPK